MCTNIFDSHAHYDDERFNEDRYDVLERLFENGVCGIVNCGSDLKTSITSINLSAKYLLFLPRQECIRTKRRAWAQKTSKLSATF